MIRYRPFMKDASRHAMAIKALDPDDWIAFGDDDVHQLIERRRLLGERPGDVLAALEGSEAAQAELVALLLAHLEQHASDRYQIENDAVLDLATGFRLSRRTAPMLALIGGLVQEDFCLLQRVDDRYVLTAAVLCFPGHWSLAEKVGKPLIDIHAPVPGFAEQLGNPVERLFDRLAVDKPVQRLNWSLVDTDVLYLPPAHKKEPVEIDACDIGCQIRLRVERQTLRRLPETEAVVFGIRTFVSPLDHVIDSAGAADALIQRLHELPAPMLTYKNLAAIRPALLAYLEHQRTAML